jgi:hypothetical protein
MKTLVIVKHGFYEIWNGAHLIGAGYALGKSPAEIAKASGLDPAKVDLCGETESRLHPVFSGILNAFGMGGK